MKVLLGAFACLRDPDRRFGFGQGGESGLGWNMIIQISKHAEVFVLTDESNREAIEERFNKEKLTGIHFYYLGLPHILGFTKKRIQLYAYVWQIKAYVVARKLHREHRFDLFHHITYANDWMASFIGALLPIPYLRGPGGGAHRVPESFTREYSLKEKLTEQIRSIGQWMFRHDPFFIIGQYRAKALLVCNQEAFDALKPSWQKKADFFPVNGISQEELLLLKNNQQKQEKNPFLIFTAGKLLKIKAFDVAIKAFAMFAEDYQDTKLVIAGDGPEMQPLRKLAKDLGVHDKVVFLGWVSKEVLLENMQRCDVFLFTSLRDGGGAVVVEAMAAAKPVVCLDIAGPGFHIDKDSGIKIKPIVPGQTIKDISLSLARLYGNKELQEALGTAAQKKVMDYYAWDVLGNRLHQLYEKILSK